MWHTDKYVGTSGLDNPVNEHGRGHDCGNRPIPVRQKADGSHDAAHKKDMVTNNFPVSANKDFSRHPEMS